MHLHGNGPWSGLARRLAAGSPRVARVTARADAPRCPRAGGHSWRGICSFARLLTPRRPPDTARCASVSSSASLCHGSGTASGQPPLHTPVMVKEVLESLDVQPGQVSSLLLIYRSCVCPVNPVNLPYAWFVAIDVVREKKTLGLCVSVYCYLNAICAQSGPIISLLPFWQPLLSAASSI